MDLICFFLILDLIFKTQQKRGFLWVLCGFVMLNSQQAKQLPSTEIQRKDKPPTWLHRELSRHCQRPQLRGDIHVASIDDIYILNEQMIVLCSSRPAYHAYRISKYIAECFVSIRESSEAFVDRRENLTNLFLDQTSENQ